MQGVNRLTVFKEFLRRDINANKLIAGTLLMLSQFMDTKQYPDTATAGIYSFGEIRATGAYWTYPPIVAHMINDVAIIFINMACESIGKGSYSQLVGLDATMVGITKDAEKQALEKILPLLKAKYGIGEYDEPKLQEFLARFDALMESVGERKH